MRVSNLHVDFYNKASFYKYIEKSVKTLVRLPDRRLIEKNTGLYSEKIRMSKFNMLTSEGV